jgi:signal transduction histidine kinase
VRRAEEQALVLDELDRMDRLVAELRLLARAERPDFLELDEVRPAALVEEVGRKVRAVADRDWRVVVPAAPSAPVVPGAPDATSPTALVADRQRLTQALLALVDNAVQVTQPGDRIEVGTEPAGAAWRLWVADDGPGIAAEDLPTLFDRSGRTVPKRPGGTGLGLPIVAAIVRAHGGEVRAVSRLGDGTRIDLVLPVAARRRAAPTGPDHPGLDRPEPGPPPRTAGDHAVGTPGPRGPDAPPAPAPCTHDEPVPEAPAPSSTAPSGGRA